jgi:putative two-component system response regulator
VVVPDSILLKPGPLTEDEMNVMRRHSEVGERICSRLKSFRLVLPIIRHHHEKRNGSGYPDGLRGEQIPLTARILQLADVYDALTTDRPYRTAVPSEEALQIMADEAKLEWWDESLFAAFREMIRESRNSTAPTNARSATK